MVALQKLYNPANGLMRVAGFMSGSGTNLRKIIEYERALIREQAGSPYEVVVIFSDNPESNAGKIGSDFNIPVMVRDANEFYSKRGKPKKDLEVRAEFDRGTVEELRDFGIDAVAYAGYMLVATPVLVDAFLGVNVHPGDLTVTGNGRRKYTGDHAVRNAILAGEKTLRATTHLIEPEVDYGRVLMLSPQLKVMLPDNFDKNNDEQVKIVSKQHQERLKEAGDWKIFSRTLAYIAQGRYSSDEKGNLYFDKRAIPNGLVLNHGVM